jgi:hypothetical protein
MNMKKKNNNIILLYFYILMSITNSTYENFDDDRYTIDNYYSSDRLENTTNHPTLFKKDEIISKDAQTSPFQSYDGFTNTYTTERSNGRMEDIDINKSYPQFELFQENHRGPEKNYGDSLTGIMQESVLSRVYFSHRNIDNLQQKIIDTIYNESKGKLSIGKQSANELKIIMRSIYLEHSKNVECKIQEQVSQLNKLVLNYCVKNIMVNATQYVNYIRELKKPTEIMDNPSNNGIAGTKTLQEKHFF